MTFQSQSTPATTSIGPFIRAVRKLSEWLSKPRVSQAEAPTSDRLRRDARLPNDAETDPHRATAQTYHDRHMPLL